MSEIHPDESGAISPDDLLSLLSRLRARPKPSEVRTQRRLERLAARRLPPRNPDRPQRGDLAEPPPVLDLAVADLTTREHVIALLRRRCTSHAVWVLPHDSAGDAARESGRGADAEAPGPTGAPTRHPGAVDGPNGVTTRALYDELEALATGFDTDPTARTHRLGRQAPPAPPFRRLRSLLLLRGIDLPAVYQRKEGSEKRRDDVELRTEDRESEGFVIEALREVKAGLSNRSSDNEPRWGDNYFRALRRVSALVARISTLVTFGKLDEKVLTPVSFAVTAAATAAPVASLGLLIERMDRLVTVVVASGLLGLYAVLALFLFLPWRRFRWLNRHRYPLEPGQLTPAALRNHRQRGIRVLNVLHKCRAATGGPGTGAGANPPGIHLLGVNAFLDDLERTYGSRRAAHRWLPRRKRRERPVLIVDQERVGEAGRYLVRLIEEERLRRGYPDPLLIVAVRTSEPPLLEREIHPERHPTLPEARGHPHSDHLRLTGWLRERQALGTLGRERLLTFTVAAPAPEAWNDAYQEKHPDSVWTPLALTGFWSAGVAATAVVALLVGGVAVPAYVQNTNPCVDEGIRVPDGIRRVGQDCVGITDGGFFFDDRLENAQRVIRDQNREIADEDHVTLVYVGSLSVLTQDNSDLAGVQGELYGLAKRQEVHNQRSGVPAIRLLVANTGHSWQHAGSVADQIVRHASDHQPDEDRVLAAVGLGHSVRATTETIATLTAAEIPMVGTTATFDDVADLPTGRPSPYFFPVAPSNSRIAERAARWARDGVRWSSDDSTAWDLEPADTAVALADNSEGESYGPHLAIRFMAEFTQREGQPWRRAGGYPEVVTPDGSEAHEGVLPYQRDGTSHWERLKEICADPPDLIYFAGRSVEFEDFYTEIQEEGRCAEGNVTILGGDDIAKYVSDNENKLANAAGFPVYYTPLAASGPWSQCADAEHSVYNELDDLIARTEGDTDAADPDTAPSMAHAAVAYDGLRVIDRALLRDTLQSPEESGRHEDDAFIRLRRSLLGHIQQTSDTYGPTGALRFGDPSSGNWYDDQLVQLVLAGPASESPDTGVTEWQRVVAAHGRINETDRAPQGCAT